MLTVKKPSRTNKDTRQKSKAENLEKSRLSAFFVASLPGFEPGAFRLGGGPSILLRYRDLYEIVVLLPFAFLGKASDLV